VRATPIEKRRRDQETEAGAFLHLPQFGAFTIISPICIAMVAATPEVAYKINQ